MNKSFKQILNEVFSDNSKWNYYNEKIAKGNPFVSGDASKNFILNFIKYSGKESSRGLEKNIEELSNDRAMHIVSTFFLGIYIYENSENLSVNINKKLETYQDKSKYSSDIKFSFIWFLASLFHDLGYKFEDEDSIKYVSFDEFFEKEKLINLKHSVGIPKLYETIHKGYFNYRAKSENDKIGKNDHGICAAYLLYTDLCKIRSEEENSYNKTNGLCWEESLEDVYNFAAWIILAHNIWYVNESAKCLNESYREAGLEKLILKPKKNKTPKYKITLAKHPFLFLFCLVDTIEPLKRVKDFSLLEKISLGIESDKIKIESKLTCTCHDTILNQANGLNSWLIPTRLKGNIVEIDLNPNHGRKL